MNIGELQQQLDLAIAHIEGVRDGLAHARALLNGGRAGALAVIAAVAAQPLDRVVAAVPAPEPALEPTRAPKPRQKGNHTKRIEAANQRRLAIARHIASDGPASITELAEELNSPYHTVHGAITRHPWFEVGDDRKVHLTPVGFAAVRGDNGEKDD